MCAEMKIEMYQKATNKDGSTAHSNECKMSFGRKDKQCHRCVELLNGASSRGGWQQKYYSDKKQQEKQDALYAKQKHDCKKSGCMVVCTHNDW